MNEGIGKGLRVKPAMTAWKKDCFTTFPRISGTSRNDGVVNCNDGFEINR